MNKGLYAAAIIMSPLILIVDVVLAHSGKFGDTSSVVIIAPQIVALTTLAIATRLLWLSSRVSHSTGCENRIEDRTVRSYSIWDDYKGTYYAINAPWQLELRNRSGSRDERKVYRQYLAAHKRRYLTNSGVRQTIYIFTADSIKRYPGQLDRFAQFFSDLKVFAGDGWPTIADRVRVVLVNGESKEARYTGTLFSGQNFGEGGGPYKSIVYVDAYGFITPHGVPDRVLISQDDRIFDSAKRYYDEIKSGALTTECKLADWLPQQIKEMRERCSAIGEFKAFSVFISYSNKDLEDCLKLKKLLEANGLNPWTDKDMSGGTGWRQQLDVKIGEATCGIFLNSKDALRSNWSKAEAAQLTRGDENRLLVVRLDKSPLLETLAHIQVSSMLQGWDGNLEDPRALALVNDVEKYLDQKGYL
jgi:TIR domain-containing protein